MGLSGPGGKRGVSWVEGGDWKGNVGSPAANWMRASLRGFLRRFAMAN